MTADQEKLTRNDLDSGVNKKELSSDQRESIDQLLSREKLYRKRAKVLEYCRSVGDEVLLALGAQVSTEQNAGNEKILSASRNFAREIVERTRVKNKFNAIRNYLNVFNDDADIDWGCGKLTPYLLRLRMELIEGGVDLLFVQIYTAVMLKRSTSESNRLRGDGFIEDSVRALEALQMNASFSTGFYDCILALVPVTENKKIVDLLWRMPLDHLDELYASLIELNRRDLAELLVLDHWTEMEQSMIQTGDRTLFAKITTRLPSLNILRLIVPYMTVSSQLGAIACKYLQANDIECFNYLIEAFPDFKERSDVAAQVANTLGPEFGIQFLEFNPTALTVAEYVRERLKLGMFSESVQTLTHFWNVLLTADDFGFRYAMRQLILVIPKCEFNSADTQSLFDLLTQLAYQYSTPIGIVELLREGPAVGMNDQMAADLRNSLRTQVFTEQFETELEVTTHKLQKKIEENDLQIGSNLVTNCLQLCLTAGKVHLGEELLITIANAHAPMAALIDANFQLIADYMRQGIIHPSREILLKLIIQEGIVPSPVNFQALIAVSDFNMKKELSLSTVVAMSSSKNFELFVTHYLSTLLEDKEYDVSVMSLEAVPNVLSKSENKALLKSCLDVTLNLDFRLRAIQIMEAKGLAVQFPYTYLTALLDAQMPQEVIRLHPVFFRSLDRYGS